MSVCARSIHINFSELTHLLWCIRALGNMHLDNFWTRVIAMQSNKFAFRHIISHNNYMTFA